MARNSAHPQLLCCPNCGYDLDKARPLRIGKLYADPFGDTYWKGEQVILTPQEREVLSALAASAKHNNHATRNFIANRLDAENLKLIDVLICRIRDKFRQIDPEFNNIETVWGEGFRWINDAPKPEAPKTVVCDMPEIPLTLYSNNEVLWQRKYRIFITARQAQLLKILVDGRGEFLDARDIWKPLGLKSHGGVVSLVNGLRHKFWEADERSQIVETWPGRGYAIVKPDYKRPVEAEVLFENEYLKLFHLEMLYKGQYRIQLSKRESQLMLLLAKAGGRYVPNEEIYRKLKVGYDTLKTMIHRGIHKKAADFLDEPIIECKKGHGYRLFMAQQGEAKRIAAGWTDFEKRGELVLYESMEARWQDEYTIKLTGNQMTIMTALYKMNGGFVSTQTLQHCLGTRHKAAVTAEIKRIRGLFAEHDDAPIIESKNGSGYRLVSPPVRLAMAA